MDSLTAEHIYTEIQQVCSHGQLKNKFNYQSITGFTRAGGSHQSFILFVHFSKSYNLLRICMEIYSLILNQKFAPGKTTFLHFNFNKDNCNSIRTIFKVLYLRLANQQETCKERLRASYSGQGIGSPTKHETYITISVLHIYAHL